MTDIGYHSAHLPTAAAVRSLDRWESAGSVAFVHDLLTGGPLPSDYDRCDLLYAEPPWQAGFDRYNSRAGIADGRTYPDLMAAVSELVRAQNRPVVLVTGRHALRLLPKPSQALPVRMPVVNRQPALALTYNMALAPMWEDTAGLLAVLASAYRRVGDFCCGYGGSARAFTVAGGTFVASDYNPGCVGYIADHAASWSRLRQRKRDVYSRAMPRIREATR